MSDKVDYYRQCLRSLSSNILEFSLIVDQLNAIETKLEHIKGGIVKRPDGKADDCLFHDLVEQKDEWEAMMNAKITMINEANNIIYFAKGQAHKVLAMRYRKGQPVAKICVALELKRSEYYNIIDNVLCMYRIAKEKENGKK